MSHPAQPELTSKASDPSRHPTQAERILRLPSTSDRRAHRATYLDLSHCSWRHRGPNTYGARSGLDDGLDPILHLGLLGRGEGAVCTCVLGASDGTGRGV